MICDTINNGGPCKKLIFPTVCSIYSLGGMRLKEPSWDIVL